MSERERENESCHTVHREDRDALCRYLCLPTSEKRFSDGMEYRFGFPDIQSHGTDDILVITLVPIMSITDQTTELRIAIDELRNFCETVLNVVGVPTDDARLVVNSIIDAHQKGKGTHGLPRLPIYVRKIQQGLMAPDTPLKVVTSAPAVVVIDACHGFGQVAGIRGMKMAVDVAARYGVGVVAVRNSNNFGAAGYIAEIATSSSMIGLVLANSQPAMAPTGGSKALLGTNPIAAAFPAGRSGIPITLDMATSAAARGKIRLAARIGESIPLGWALGKDGHPTTDPAAALEGTMLPLGGPKGYGLALSIDILAGLLSGSAFGGDVRGLNHPNERSRNGHLLMALSVAHFMDYQEYKEEIDRVIDRVHLSGLPDEVRLPGEASWRGKAQNLNHVPVSSAVVQDVNEMARTLGMDLKLSAKA